MLIEYPLNTAQSTAYARRWAFSRNPAFYDFDGVGGDCTNFVSQCLWAGGAAMNYTPDLGWYYRSPEDRAAAWTGVEYFYNFITTNAGVGPFGEVVPVDAARTGDVIQLGSGGGYYHTLFVVAVRRGEPYIAAHTYDAFNRALSTYTYDEIRCMHIIGSRREI